MSHRYAMPIGLVILFLAAVGFGSLRVPAWSRGFGASLSHLRWRRIDLRTAIAMTRSCGGRVGSCPGQAVRTTRSVHDRGRWRQPQPGGRCRSAGSHHQEGTRFDAGRVRSGDRLRPMQDQAEAGGILSVQTLDRPRLADDLGLPVSGIADNSTTSVGLDELVAVPGRVIYHDRRRDTGSDLDALEDSSSPTLLGWAMPRSCSLASDATRGYWLWQVAPTGRSVDRTEHFLAGGLDMLLRTGPRMPAATASCGPERPWVEREVRRR